MRGFKASLNRPLVDRNHVTESCDTDATLHAYLENLETRLQDLMERAFVADPDDVAAQLAVDTAFVTDSVDAILAEFAAVSRQRTNLNEVIDQAAREFLLSGDHQVTIKAVKDPLLVGLPYSFGLLFAAVSRALQIAFEYGGATTELTLRTATDGYRDTLTVRAHCAGRDGDRRPAEERVVSLHDLLSGMGGSVEVTERDECLELSLRFETRTSPV